MEHVELWNRGLFLWGRSEPIDSGLRKPATDIEESSRRGKPQCNLSRSSYSSSTEDLTNFDSAYPILLLSIPRAASRLKAPITFALKWISPSAQTANMGLPSHVVKESKSAKVAVKTFIWHNATDFRWEPRKDVMVGGKMFLVTLHRKNIQS